MQSELVSFQLVVSSSVALRGLNTNAYVCFSFLQMAKKKCFKVCGFNRIRFEEFENMKILLKIDYKVITVHMSR